jgi:amidase
VGFLGAPAVSLPAGFGKNGLPLGIQIVGAYRQVYHTLRLAKRVEQALKLDRRIPSISIGECDGRQQPA